MITIGLPIVWPCHRQKILPDDKDAEFSFTYEFCDMQYGGSLFRRQ